MESKLNIIRQKWQKRWDESRIFEPSVKDQKKFFLTFPYPYINAFPHIGHLYTIVRVDALARYKRLMGYNVLFPQGWHATGSPIVSAAKRVRQKEKKQLKILADMGISGDELKKFEDPEHWITYFAPECKKDYSDLGLSIDWRREFFTTSLNPHYDKFIQWQFRKLKEKDYVIKGRFPVVWDPKENVPVGDHDRVEGEGETPQEYVLLKFKLGDEFLIAATLRPETMYGQTNLWVGPDIRYAKARVNGEIWIASEECFTKLAQQDHKVEIIGNIRGEELIGKKAEAPVINRLIPVLPAGFCRPDKGSGIVTSVPSDAPDDWMGIVDLRNDPQILKKYGVDQKVVDDIEVIPIIRSSDLGDTAAIKVVQDMGIKNSKERDKLEKAKKLVYKKGFYEGVMLDSCGPYSGMKVALAKEQIKRDLLSQGAAELFYELTGRVVSRSLSECVVKIVSDQWFLNYADPAWKKLAHRCLDNMKIYPEKGRQQFDYVIDWLHEWACTREEGLGTRLPWDRKWLIESLSDSTIYMAYYTISHRIKELDIGMIDDDFFDYIFLGKETKTKVKDSTMKDLKKEFDYWYPLDFRNSGKDLIQNHLTFSIFNHTAIFPEKHWPRSFGVNGWVTVDGQKMSKSLGNMIPVREMIKKYSADVPRATILSGGEELDDPNWDTGFADSISQKLLAWLDLIKENHGKGREDKQEIDLWLESRVAEALMKTKDHYENTLFRSAFQAAFFELGRHIRWYLRRCRNSPNKSTLDLAFSSQAIAMSPITPHICEEAWEIMGKEGFISLAAWPKPGISIKDDTEWLIKNLTKDIKTISRLAKVEKIRKATIFIADSWKYDLFEMLKNILKKTRDPKKVISEIMASELKQHGREVMKIIPKIIRSAATPDFMDKKTETSVIMQSKDFLEHEFGCRIEVVDASDSSEAKAGQAMPGKPALLIE